MFPRLFLLTAILTLMSTNPAFAEKDSPAKSLGTFGSWQTYLANENGQKVCYMALRTQGVPLKKSRRGNVIIMITQRPSENSRDVVSYNAGYNFKAASDLKITVGKTSFDLFTKGDTAWSRDAMTDHAVTNAILKNSTLTATGTPVVLGAKPVTDTITLKGAPDAYRSIGKACGMAPEMPPNPAPAQKKKAKS